MRVAQHAHLLPPPVRRVVRRQVVRYRSLGMEPEDVLLLSYPKSGSTWLRFLLAHALTGTEADFDSIRESIPAMGRHRRSPAIVPGGGRLIRSHEPLGRNRSQRVVYLVRDGRDVALSYLAHQRRYQRYHGEIEAFLDLFLAGRVDSYGPWHQHVLGALAGRHDSNRFLLVRYEELRGSPAWQLARILAFLGCERDPAGLEAVVAANSKDRMRAKEADSQFLGSLPTDGTPLVRADRPGGWAEDVPPAHRRRFDAVCGRALIAAGYEVAAADSASPVPPGARE